MITKSADQRVFWGIYSGDILPLFLNFKFLHQKRLVRWLYLGYRVLRYSQLCIAKKIAIIRSWVRAISQSVVMRLNIFWRTDAGSAFWFLMFFLLFLYPLYFYWMRKQVLPSGSKWAYGLSLALKDWGTYERVDLMLNLTRNVLFWQLKVAWWWWWWCVLVSRPGRHAQIMRCCGLEQVLFWSIMVPTSESGLPSPRIWVTKPYSLSRTRQSSMPMTRDKWNEYNRQITKDRHGGQHFLN